MDDIVKEFLVESNENLDRLEKDFVALEKDPNDTTLLSSIFRAIHTVKGTCGFLDFVNLERVTHAGENLLSLLRDGVLTLTPELTNALLSMVDAVRTMLSIIETTEKDGEETYDDLVKRLNALCEAPSHAVEVVVNEIPPAVVEEAESAKATPTASSSKDSSIRVEVGLLDRLMNLVGELVLTRNQILQFTSKHNDPTLQATSQRLNLITRELQEGAMKTRMQPIYNIWGKFPRVVRDLSQSLGKQVEVLMEGKETEIDKSIIESIKDPLTHLVRNSIDHGIEKPDVRLQKGKEETGTLILKAYHESGMVNIEISDDGAGIDVSRIKEKALERGLMSKEQLANAKDNEIMNLIFMPGFSTAETVTHVSGRGVGMDVVKTNIEKIGGEVDIQSTLGKGSTIKIKIPLTLAIIPGLIVTCDNDRYVIPQVNLVELVLIDQEQNKHAIEFIHNIPIYRLRGQLLPLVVLRSVLGLNQEDSQVFLKRQESISIVVLQANNNQFGLVVDSINDTQEIVVKPLSKLLKGLSVFTGATIMGDGQVALILDTLGIAGLSNMIYDNLESVKSTTSNDETTAQTSKQSVVLFKLNTDNLMAVPLNLVSRLEEFNYERIEHSGLQEVIQYHEQAMPLIRLSSLLFPDYLPEEPVVSQDSVREPLHVLIITHQQHTFGLVVEAILDIIDDVIIEGISLPRDGVIGSAIIQDKVTEIIDLEWIVHHVLPNYFCSQLESNQMEKSFDAN